MNALDGRGRTVLACIIQGIPKPALDASDACYSCSERVEALRLLLNHPNISLFTLNASDPQGATPLGAAAGMNLLEIVQSLLADSSGAVSVDGIDSCGATALMHACYAGNVEVVRTLLKHGARPDFRDSTGCTAIQRALGHPDILWMCELSLRRHRWRRHSAPTRPSIIWDDVLKDVECSLPSSHDPTPPGLSALPEGSLQDLSQNLSEYTSGRDLETLHSILFPFSPSTSAAHPPLLVNLPDARGWSPIHHCTSAEEPSLEVLMALYFAGADLSLPTPDEQFTPLHCLVSVSRSPTAESLTSLLGFVVHLVRDLGSSLVAHDRNEETPMHIAAEHGTCLEVLAFLLELDSTGAAKEVRNSRGLTPREVAKPEFRVAFGMDVEQLRSLSSLSMMTVKPLASRPIERTSSQDDVEPSWNRMSTNLSVDGYGSPSPFEVLEQLSFASSLLDRDPDYHHDNEISRLGSLKETQDNLENLLEHHRTNASLARQELDQLTTSCASVERLLNTVGCSVDAEMSRRGLRALNFNRGSEDSQLTAVSSPHSFNRSRTTSAPSPSPFQGPTSRRSEPYLRARSNTVGSKVSLAKSTKSTAEKNQAQKLSMKFTSWFKRKVAPLKFLQPHEEEEQEVIIDDDESFLCDDFDPTRTLQEDFYIDEPLESAMQWSFVVLNAARRDLASIRLYAQELSASLAKSEDAIARVERLASQILHRCSAKLHQTQLQRMDEDLSSYYDIFTCPPRDLSPPCRPTLSSASSMCSISSVASESSLTAAPADSAELKSIRRLLVRRVAGRLDKIQSHIQNEVHWLFIVEEAVKDVKRRTYVL